MMRKSKVLQYSVTKPLHPNRIKKPKICDSVLSSSQTKKSTRGSSSTVTHSLRSSPSTSSMFSSSGYSDFLSSRKESLSSEKRSNSAETIISEVFEENDEEIVINQKDQPGFIHAIFMPLLLDESLRQIKQPIMIKIRESQFIDFGFDLPFTDYFDFLSNLFEVEFQKFKLSGPIIATGESPRELKTCLTNCIKKNPNWNHCEKMIGNSKLFKELKHVPLVKRNQCPKQKVISSKDFESLKNFIENLAVDDDKPAEKEYDISPYEKKEDTSIDVESDGSLKKEKENKKRRQKDDRDDSSGKNSICVNQHRAKSSSEKDKIFARIKEKISLCNERKPNLAKCDTISLMVSDITDILDDLYLILSEKEISTRELLIKIPEEDETYKIEQANRIFVEGLIQFELDKYQEAVSRAKTKVPFSFAYQLVSVCFPEQYYKNVTFGKKYYKENELQEFLKLIKSEKITEKFPLCFVWGFKDPFGKPFQGNFDSTRGYERVKAFVVHIFRKSKIFEYNDDLEKEVRIRIGKELCAKNANSRKRQTPIDLDSDGNSMEENQEINGKESSASIWNSKCFS